MEHLSQDRPQNTLITKGARPTQRRPRLVQTLWQLHSKPEQGPPGKSLVGHSAERSVQTGMLSRGRRRTATQQQGIGKAEEEVRGGDQLAMKNADEEGGGDRGADWGREENAEPAPPAITRRRQRRQLTPQRRRRRRRRQTTRRSGPCRQGPASPSPRGRRRSGS